MPTGYGFQYQPQPYLPPPRPRPVAAAPKPQPPAKPAFVPVSVPPAAAMGIELGEPTDVLPPPDALGINVE